MEYLADKEPDIFSRIVGDEARTKNRVNIGLTFIARNNFKWRLIVFCFCFKIDTSDLITWKSCDFILLPFVQVARKKINYPAFLSYQIQFWYYFCSVNTFFLNQISKIEILNKATFINVLVFSSRINSGSQKQKYNQI